MLRAAQKPLDSASRTTVSRASNGDIAGTTKP
jgi:hypothetical protein